MTGIYSHQTPGPVVVPVDGTADSARAIRFAVAEARRRGVGLRLVHVLHETVPTAPMLPLFTADTLREIGARILEGATSQAHQLGDLHVQALLEHGPRAAAILERSRDASCIVLGPRPSSLHRVVTGSTTTAVAARAHCPVFCVPAGWRYEVDHHRVVVGVDGSSASSDVLRAGFEAALDRHAALSVVHAWRPTGQYDAAIGGRVLAERWEQGVRPVIAEIVAGWRTDYPDVDLRLDLRYQRPAAALADAGRVSDLLVMGRRGEGGPLGLSLGSMSRAQIRAGACPVEIVPVRQGAGQGHARHNASAEAANSR